MRRKLFFYALFLTFVVGISLSIAGNHNTFSQDGIKGIYIGKVVSVDVGESNTKLVIDTGDKGQILGVNT